MKKRINLRLILIAGIAVIVTMICMTGIYYKLFQGQVRKDLQINARLLSDTGLFDDSDNTNVSLSEYYEVGEDLRVLPGLQRMVRYFLIMIWIFHSFQTTKTARK